MIAILAAVPIETELLRRSLSPCEVRSCGRRNYYRGTLAGRPVSLMHSGVGKANAAAAITSLLFTERPEAVVVIGCAGAYPDASLEIGEVALASEEIFGDEGVITPGGFIDMEELGFPLIVSGGARYYNRFASDPRLLHQARGILREPPVGPFVTVSTCSGILEVGRALAQRTGGICENMEGAAVAQVCALHNIPFLEIRGISNQVEDRDPSRWDLRRGAEAAQIAARHLLGNWHLRQEPA
jgi:futalosine hydrolase